MCPSRRTTTPISVGFKPWASGTARNRSNCRRVDDDTPSGPWRGRLIPPPSPRIDGRSANIRLPPTWAPFSTLYPLGDSRSLTAQSALSEAWQNSGHPSPVMCPFRLSPPSDGFPILSIRSHIYICAGPVCVWKRTSIITTGFWPFSRSRRKFRFIFTSKTPTDGRYVQQTPRKHRHIPRRLRNDNAPMSVRFSRTDIQQLDFYCSYFLWSETKRQSSKQKLINQSANIALIILNCSINKTVRNPSAGRDP